MARPPQYAHGDDDLPANVAAVKAQLKRLTPKERAAVVTWLLLYFGDNGERFSPQLERRQRIVLNGEEFWLARVPKRDS